MRNWVYIDQGYQKAEHCTAFMRFKGLLTGRYYGDGAGQVRTPEDKQDTMRDSKGSQQIHTAFKRRKGFYFTGVLTSRYYGDGTGLVRKPGTTSCHIPNVL